MDFVFVERALGHIDRKNVGPECDRLPSDTKARPRRQFVVFELRSAHRLDQRVMRVVCEPRIDVRGLIRGEYAEWLRVLEI